ncbi:MAG: hypothetical protein ABH843_05070 [Candidatus Omnitrophota bacterium]
MSKKITYILFLMLLCVSSLSYAQTERVELSTYYPSPSGRYQELRSKWVGAGDNFGTRGGITLTDNIPLRVEQNVGIGTVNPIERLEIASNPPVGRDQIRIVNTLGTSSIIGHDATGPFTRVLNNAARWSVRNQGGTQILTVVPNAVAANQRVLIGNPPVSNYNLDVGGSFRVYNASGVPALRLETPGSTRQINNNGGNFTINSGGATTDLLYINATTKRVGMGTNNPGTDALRVVGAPLKAQGGIVIEKRAGSDPPANGPNGQMWLRTDI